MGLKNGKMGIMLSDDNSVPETKNDHLNDSLESWELTDFNIDGHIALSQKFGHLKMMRSDDGKLILAGNTNYGHIDQTKPTPTNFFNPDTTLGFILDIGIQKEKRLTYGSGFYFGQQMLRTQSQKKVSQVDFDLNLFEKIGDKIQILFQSGDHAKEIEAIKIQYLFDEYNNARLLYPNFYAESYLNLMRIIDALADARGAYDYAIFIANISHKMNQEVFNKLKAMSAYADKLVKAEALFDKCEAHAKSKSWTAIHDAMLLLNQADKFVFSCFYSAYQYRNKFVHKGFPFPSIVKDSWGIEDDSGMAYISPTFGQSLSRFHRPETGLQDGDLLDIHAIVGTEAEDFKDTYFLLVPTWHYLKKIAREAILVKFNSL